MIRKMTSIMLIGLMVIGGFAGVILTTSDLAVGSDLGVTRYSVEIYKYHDSNLWGNALR